jgi:hypothetical protein
MNLLRIGQHREQASDRQASRAPLAAVPAPEDG